MTVEEFNEWSKARDRVADVATAADEEGGPSLSLVPLSLRNDAWPTDLLPPASQSPGLSAGPGAEPAATAIVAPIVAPIVATPFDGQPLEDSRKRLAGWSADRQRLFLSTLAETGSVHLASSGARLSARGAYRLRTRSPAFARAWDTALQLAVGRLSAIVFDRAINGRVEQIYQAGSWSASGACRATNC
jgi:hypothetical protein